MASKDTDSFFFPFCCTCAWYVYLNVYAPGADGCRPTAGSSWPTVNRWRLTAEFRWLTANCYRLTSQPPWVMSQPPSSGRRLSFCFAPKYSDVQSFFFFFFFLLRNVLLPKRVQQVRLPVQHAYEI